MDTIENFMGIFPAAVSKELCERTIEHFHYIQKTRDMAGEVSVQDKSLKARDCRAKPEVPSLICIFLKMNHWT